MEAYLLQDNPVAAFDEFVESIRAAGASRSYNQVSMKR